MSTLDRHTLSLTPGQRVELYTLDLTPYGGPMTRFCPAREDLTPATVTRLTDDTSGTREHRGTLIPGVVQGDRVQVEAFVRVESAVGADPRTRISIMGALSNASDPERTASVLTNLSTGVTAFFYDQGDDDISDIASASAAASEFYYLSVSATVDWTGDVYVRIQPQGMDATHTGSVDIAHLRVWRVTDGIRVPCMIEPDISKWDGDAGVTNDVANTYNCVKVPIWQGHPYTPVPIHITGFEKTGNGKFPKPLVQVSNLAGAGNLLLTQYGDIRGAEVTRTRLYAENLDNGPDPDPLAFYTPDLFLLDRVAQRNGRFVEFELATPLDQQGVQLPQRQVLRDVCPWRYRVWNGTSFDYDPDAEGCPYNGTAYFDAEGNSVANPEDDVCSQKLTTGCRKRYGITEALPFGGFPMVGRQRQ